VTVLESRIDTPWVRDFGPLEVHERDGSDLWLDFAYSWERPSDDALPRWLSAFVPTRVESSEFVLDGGAVVSNGQGLCALTARSLARGGFAPQASHELTPLLVRLGCAVTAILPELPEEPTGHADLAAQFLTPTLVAVAWVDPGADALVAARFEDAAEALTAAAGLASVPLDIVRVPIEVERAIYYSYVNVTRLENRLLVPGFAAPRDRSERAAYRILQSSLPGIELVRIPSDAMARRHGGVHCVTLGLGRPGRRRG
jgi:agmatine/peptidylarginine deiminase